MINYSKHVISICNKYNKYITNVHLQKLLLFSIGRYVTINGIDDYIKSIYKEPMSMGIWGALDKKSYLYFKKYGRLNLSREGEYQNEFSKMDTHIKYFIYMDSMKLVKWTVNMDSFKKNRFRHTFKNEVVYTLETIKDDFSKFSFVEVEYLDNSQTMFDLANHILSISNEQGIKLNNSNLNQVMFMVLAKYILTNGNENLNSLYIEKFTIQNNIPKIKMVYKHFEKYRRGTIRERGNYFNSLSFFDNYIYLSLNNNYFKFANDYFNDVVVNKEVFNLEDFKLK